MTDTTTSGTSPTKKPRIETVGAAAAGQDNSDEVVDKALESIESCQNEIDALNEKASEEILKVEQKYNKLRKPHYENRNDFIKKIPNFWVNAFINHAQMSANVTEEDIVCLHYMSKLSVEESEDIKSGYKISFTFEENPYFENRTLVKEFKLGSEETRPMSNAISVRWKKDMDLTKRYRESASGKGQKRPHTEKSFFFWFTDEIDPSWDTIGEIIKDDLWPNPLQYYLSSEVGENGIEDDSGELDESVVVLDEDNSESDGDEIQEISDEIGNDEFENAGLYEEVDEDDDDDEDDDILVEGDDDDDSGDAGNENET